MLVWKITAISLKVPRCAKWTWFSSGKKTDKRSGKAFPISAGSSAIPLSSPFHKARLSQRPARRGGTDPPTSHSLCSFGWATASCPGCDIGSAINKLDKHLKGGEQEGEEVQHLGPGRGGWGNWGCFVRGSPRGQGSVSHTTEDWVMGYSKG